VGNIHAEFRLETWPLSQPFMTSRETTAKLQVLYCELQRGGCIGRAEAVGVDYHGETPASIKRFLEERASTGTLPWDRLALLEQMPAGGARNAIDCALWDLEAKGKGRRVWELAGVEEPRALRTTFTIGLADPSKMAADVVLAPPGAVLKLKLGARDGRDVDRVSAVRRAAPESDLVVDVNEAWSLEELNDTSPALQRLGVSLIEQPLPVAHDALLDGYVGALALCADESFSDHSSFATLHPRYSCINIKLDKCGGLTEALCCATTARTSGLELFAGNMLGTSLAMAPAFILAQQCRWVDLDGPLLLSRDREPAFIFTGSMMQPFGADLWG
jgi:L-alanine-DL-glutamate epimerase-like enolase superfamily enzyme